MQTFLPYKSFAQSARVLDRPRLGKQRVETLQIMGALVLGTGWVNHPATKMWRGYEAVLLQYQAAVCLEWVSRGYRDSCWEKTIDIFVQHEGEQLSALPLWLGSKQLHSSHRANLLRKDPDHYGKFGWVESPTEGYYWPVTK